MNLIISLLFAALPACGTEDSTNCAWDSDKAGNGTGSSFVDLGGVTYFTETFK